MQLKDEVKRNMACYLTKEELLEKAKILSRSNREYQETKDHAKGLAAEFNGKLKVLEGEIAIVSEHISSGFVYRDVPCSVTYAVPTRLEKTICRQDTGETFVERMTPDEIHLWTQAIEQTEKDGAALVEEMKKDGKGPAKDKKGGVQ